MIFSSPAFTFLFLPIAFLLHGLTPSRMRNFVLLLLSLVFYAWGEARHLWLLLLLIGIGWLAGLGITSSGFLGRHRGAVLAGAISADLAALAWFKYAHFAAANLPWLERAIPSARSFAAASFVLPLGISFYVFHSISYVVDVYRRAASPRRNPIDFALYIAFFPQLIAGPIVRYHDIAAMLDRRRITVARFAAGIERFVVGLSKKMLIANTTGPVADQLFATPPDQLTAAVTWTGVVFYALQIYFDFSGYSDMAIGLARMFGFDFLENFNYPYIAGSVQEFWRRWHISLSNWFRDYLYNSSRRQPARPCTHLHEPADSVPLVRPVARRRLDLRLVGCCAWLLPGA